MSKSGTADLVPGDGNSEILTTYVLQARTRTPKRACVSLQPRTQANCADFPIPTGFQFAPTRKQKVKVMFLHLAGGIWLVHVKVREPIVAPIRSCSTLE